MAELRDTGTIDPARFDDPTIQFYDFYKLEFSAPTGTLRFTNKPGGFVGDIDGSEQTWEEYDVRTGRLAQGRDSILDVSWIDFADLDNAISELCVDPGILFVPATIYRGHFNVETDALFDAYVIYEGRCDEAQAGSRCRISLVPHRTHMGKPVPLRRIDPLCQNEYGDAMCQRTPDVTFPDCPKTGEACAARGNLVHRVAFDLIPPAQLRITWGPIQVKLDDNPAPPPTIAWWLWRGTPGYTGP